MEFCKTTKLKEKKYFLSLCLSTLTVILEYEFVNIFIFMFFNL